MAAASVAIVWLCLAGLAVMRAQGLPPKDSGIPGWPTTANFPPNESGSPTHSMMLFPRIPSPQRRSGAFTPPQVVQFANQQHQTFSYPQMQSFQHVQQINPQISVPAMQPLPAFNAQQMTSAGLTTSSFAAAPPVMPTFHMPGRLATTVGNRESRLRTASAEVDLNNIDIDEIVSQADNGELPPIPVLSAIFQSPAQLGAKLPAEIKNLKEHLLDRIINHNKMLMRALESNEDVLIQKIADRIHKTKSKGDVHSSTVFDSLPVGSLTSDEDRDYSAANDGGDGGTPSAGNGTPSAGNGTPSAGNGTQSSGDANDDPALPLIVGFDPFLEKPKPSFFGKIKGWFRKSKKKTNTGNFVDNNQTAANSFGDHNGAWARSTIYYPPLQYSSHLIPVSSGAFDLKNYSFRPYRLGHPRIAGGRHNTRLVIGRTRDLETDEEDDFETEEPQNTSRRERSRRRQSRRH